MKLNKVLVANRGEIACRIIKTLKKMSITAVAVCSDMDSNAKHVQMADESVYIGSGPPSNNYLNINAICSAAIKSGAQAVHPGFGFLSENAEFVMALEHVGVIFIGPGYEAVKVMGNKISSKKIAVKAGVNVAAGYLGELLCIDEAYEHAKAIGFPVLIKAVAGGGGKGMRLVESSKNFAQYYEMAASEALKSFDDGHVFIEKYIEKPRHIEIQVLADTHGNVVCLGERECSIQRRHQKIIEESPSCFISNKTRKCMYEQSVLLAKAISYSSAGTVEFIVAPDGQFYFLEMNTRLQVEHPVTELVTGLDIVREMVEIAEGKCLSYTQDSIKVNGWAIEARIYAEDPEKNFFPFSGRLMRYKEPSGVRVDSGVREGDYINMYYDPMIAKLCVHGKDRREAIDKMQKALGEFYISGVKNNLLFLESVFKHPVFVTGDIHTGFIDEFYPEGFSSDPCLPINASIFIAAMSYIGLINWCKDIGDYERYRKKFSVRSNDSFHDVECVSFKSNEINIKYNGECIVISSLQLWPGGEGICRLIINGVEYPVKIERGNGMLYNITYNGIKCAMQVYSREAALLYSIMPEKADDSASNNVKASIAGLIVKIMVSPGSKVAKGDPLFIISAMKMENTFYSESNKMVKKILFSEGQTVQSGEVIIELHENES